MTTRKQLGNQGETFTTQYLQQQGYTILARNYRKRFGEIDIIACKEDVLAFVEVKARTWHYINPEEIIVPSKQTKIIMTAQTFVAEHNYTDKVLRFDVAFVSPVNTSFEITYLPNAFTQEYD